MPTYVMTVKSSYKVSVIKFEWIDYFGDNSIVFIHMYHDIAYNLTSLHSFHCSGKCLYRMVLTLCVIVT
jgi:hypothetical protein